MVRIYVFAAGAEHAVIALMIRYFVLIDFQQTAFGLDFLTVNYI